MTEIYQIAGRVIEIRSFYRAVHQLCADYRFHGSPDFTVETVREDLEFERAGAAREQLAAGRTVTAHPDAYWEALAIYRKMADRMVDYDTLLFHSSVVAVDGVAYAFAAKSGMGKSTHTALWRQQFGSRAVMVNDDKPLIRVTSGGAIVCGTPWRGKHGLGENIQVPLKAICLLERAKDNGIVRIDSRRAYPMLLQQTYRPRDSLLLSRVLALVDRLAAQVDLYRLGCNQNIEAAQVAYRGMNADKGGESHHEIERGLYHP